MVRRTCVAETVAARSRLAAVSGFTLVEMLVAMAITLVMMAAVVTLFANVTNSVRNRRATVEMNSQVRHLRNVLQSDLQGATCPGLTWQRPESNHGYIEIIEGQYREGNASNLINARPNDSPPRNWPPTPADPEVDHALSILPSSNLQFAAADWATDGAGLGDFDDVLMLTSRNEEEPFVGRVPQAASIRATNDNILPFYEWQADTIESPLAEVVWFAVENPGYTTADRSDDPSAEGFFGEPGMRTIYRRTLLIAPWFNPYRDPNPSATNDPDVFTFEGRDFKAQPGLVRLLPDRINREDLAQALAALVAFQERFDLSVRLEWDPHLGDDGRYKIVANTLGDLTKRENRYEHYGFRPHASQPVREYPFAAVSWGSGYSGSNPPVVCWPDPETPNVTPYNTNPSPRTEGNAILDANGMAVAYSLRNPFPSVPPDLQRSKYLWRPFAYVEENSATHRPATARVMLNDKENGREMEVVRIVHGPVPLAGERRGEDVMMTDVVAFDLRVFDPGAPLFRHALTDTVLEPADPGWVAAYVHADNMGSGRIGNNLTTSATFPYVGQGAFVDLGYGFGLTPLKAPFYANKSLSASEPWFFAPPLQMSYSRLQDAPVREGGALSDVYGTPLAPGFAVYDTWSFHYENNGLNEDNDEVLANGTWQVISGSPAGTPQIDEGTNGLEDYGHYAHPNPTPTSLTETAVRLGVDDVGERETTPPYDKPLRGIQVVVRTYERDSRAIRQVRVNQHFMGE